MTLAGERFASVVIITLLFPDLGQTRLGVVIGDGVSFVTRMITLMSVPSLNWDV